MLTTTLIYHSHLQENGPKREMLKGKLVFKQFADKTGVKIAHMLSLIEVILEKSI